MLTKPLSAKIDHNYLTPQFADAVEIWLKIQRVVERGDFTLGKEMRELEDVLAQYLGVHYAMGVNSGTDALILIIKSLKLRGEILVPAFGFVATPAAVELAGARIKFVDVDEDFNVDINRLESYITPHTEAIMPVHWAGRPCHMSDINKIAHDHSLVVIEDACHALGAISYKGQRCGSMSYASAFSFHPLKNVNGWGDGGLIATNNYTVAQRVRSYRNHGLSDRNTCQHWGHNSRLDTLQAVVISHIFKRLPHIVNRRRENSTSLSILLTGIPQIKLPPPHPGMTYYLYAIRAQNRDALAECLNANGIDAKVHYPVPLHLQPAAAKLGHKRGDFPGAEAACNETLSLPVHEYVTQGDLEHMASLIRSFYEGKV